LTIGFTAKGRTDCTNEADASKTFASHGAGGVVGFGEDDDTKHVKDFQSFFAEVGLLGVDRKFGVNRKFQLARYLFLHNA
jgi:hypothetical protein